jgi:hypothetical protein
MTVTFVTKHSQAKEEIRMRQAVLNPRDWYRDRLKEVLNPVNFSQTGVCCDQLGEIGISFARLSRRRSAENKRCRRPARATRSKI